MGIDRKAIAIHFRKVMVCSLRSSFRFSCSHPFVVVTAILSVLTYRFLPSVFAFFVSSSPVIVCTALLLGLLLSAGQRAAEAEEEAEKRDRRIPSLKAEAAANHLVLMKNESLDVRTNGRKRSGPTEKVKKEVGLGGEGVSSAPKRDREDLIGVKKVVAEREFAEKNEFQEDKQGGIAEGHFIGQGKKIHKPSSGIPDTHLADHGDSSDSDHAESCSPDASVAEMEPRLDELHPLLDDGAPQQPAPSPSTASGSASQHSSSHESENGSDEAIEDDENQDEGVPEDGTEAVVKWTADDEKNLIHLGTSELERNQRLENLIVKRSASKKERAAAVEKNLIDLESNDPQHVRTPIMDQFAHFQVQVPPPVFTRRNNPFDLAYSTIPGLPPVPGSAPSVLLPRRNPFDLPYDQPEGGDQMGASSSQAQVEPIPHKDMFFRRIESFNLGASAPMGNRHGRPLYSNLKPYFVAEQAEVNEHVHPPLQRQLSGESDSKSSSSPESDTSSVADQVEDHEVLNQRVQLNSRMKPVENEFSEDANSMETQQYRDNVNDVMVQEIGAKASDAISEMHEGSSSSSFIQSDVKIFETIAGEQSNRHQATGQGAPSASLAPVRVDREVLENTNYGPVKEPVFDSSPSAAAKSSFSVLSTATASDAQIPISGVSSRLPVDRMIPLEDALEGLAKKDWVASTSLSFVDRDEFRSRVVSEVSEAAVLQAVLESSMEGRPMELHFVHPQSNADGMTDTSASEKSVISI
ncbi:hypothetical protein ACLOJK_017005 [Asimina triloba]